MISIYNIPKILNISEDFFSSSLQKVLSSQFKSGNISIIFVSKEEIKRLNKEYRKKGAVTDVLSFSFDTKELLGEVYVCPDYILEKYPKEEVYRATIHGILHLYGYDHKKEFVDINEENLENIFVIQELILSNLLKILCKS